MEAMEAIIWNGGEYPQSLSYGMFPVPKLKRDWVLVRNLAAGICGSDLHLLLGRTRQTIPDANLPAILGHENAGVIAAIGEGVTGLAPGDWVAIEPLHGCIEFGGSCAMCRQGKYHLCLHGLTHVGIPAVRMIPGGYGEYSVAHASRVYKIPSSVSLVEAALLDGLAVAVHAVNLARPRLGDIALVYGCGVIGLDVIQCLAASGVQQVIAIAKYDFQAEAAQELGAAQAILSKASADLYDEIMTLTRGMGADLVFECAGGSEDTLNPCVQLCSLGGKVILIGEFGGKISVDLLRLQTKEVNLISSNSYAMAGARHEFQIALDLLANGRVNHQRLITHTFAPRDYQQAFDAVIDKGRNKLIKALFVRT